MSLILGDMSLILGDMSLILGDMSLILGDMSLIFHCLTQIVTVNSVSFGYIVHCSMKCETADYVNISVNCLESRYT